MRLLALSFLGCVVALPALAGDNFVLEDEIAICAGCHGQSNKGMNVPSGHLGGRVNLSPAELDAINSL